MIEAHSPIQDRPSTDCAGCGGTKDAPIATILMIYHRDVGITVALCEVCGRDVANAVGFMCIRDGGWSKIVSRKGTRPGQTEPKKPRSGR